MYAWGRWCFRSGHRGRWAASALPLPCLYPAGTCHPRLIHALCRSLSGVWTSLPCFLLLFFDARQTAAFLFVLSLVKAANLSEVQVRKWRDDGEDGHMHLHAPEHWLRRTVHRAVPSHGLGVGYVVKWLPSLMSASPSLLCWEREGSRADGSVDKSACSTHMRTWVHIMLKKIYKDS